MTSTSYILTCWSGLSPLDNMQRKLSAPNFWSSAPHNPVQSHIINCNKHKNRVQLRQHHQQHMQIITPSAYKIMNHQCSVFRPLQQEPCSQSCKTSWHLPLHLVRVQHNVTTTVLLVGLDCLFRLDKVLVGKTKDMY